MSLVRDPQPPDPSDPEPGRPSVTFEVHLLGPGRIALEIVGEVDLATAPTVDRVVGGMVPAVGVLAVDAGGVSFCDLHGLRVFERFATDGPTGTGTVEVVATSPAIDRLIDLLELPPLVADL